MQHHAAPYWLIPALFAAFVLLWCTICWLISFMSGWHELAEEWRARDVFDGSRLRFCSGELRWRCHYNNILTLGADRFGLSMDVLFLFRPGHPALFIPWNAIAISPKRRGIVFPRVGLELGRNSGVTLWLFDRTARRLLAKQERLWLL